MKVETFQYVTGRGWSVDSFPDLDSENTLIFIFSAPEFLDHPEPFQTLSKKYPRSKMIGCSSAGEILGSSIYDHSISVAVVKFEKTPLKLSLMTVDNSENSFRAGKALGEELDAPNLSAIFVLSEGLIINGSELVKGLNTINRKDVVITGGLAGDADRFKKTWVIENGKIYTNKVVAVGFYGKYVHVSHGSKGGWDIFGVERHITRSNGNVLYELDGKSALALYKEYLGDKANGLPATGLLYPLAIRKNLDDPKQLVRTILSINEKEGSLTFAGDVPMGYLAQLMRANFDRLVTGAKDAGELVLSTFDGIDNKSPVLLIAVSCVGRRLLLGERTEEETENVLNLFPKGTEMVGFYSYGEISPYTKGNCDLHNQTMTLTSIFEEN